MIVNVATLAKMAKKASSPNMQSVILALMKHPAGLEKPHRLAMFLGQLAHESGFFIYDQEIWGPTAAQKRYEGRKNLGNTKPGDGYKFRGRGPIQCTGGSNYRSYTLWCRANINATAPDFDATPDLLLTDPWEGLSAIWFWEVNGLNAVADTGSIERVTKIINGGTNGAADRIEKVTAVSLTLLGYKSIAAFQIANKNLKADGVAGPKTRAALHQALKSLPPVTFTI